MSSLTYQLVLAGLAVGSAAALTGVGLIVTYRATGVLNLAHGAVAMVCAYVLRQFAVEWGWPLWAAAGTTLLVVAPAIGLVLDRVVFRPAAVRGADPARTLVASIGVFVLLVGGAVLVWGGGARADAPVLLGDAPWAQLAVALALACAVGGVTRWTRLGRELRAVVDNRDLAALDGVDTNRVAATGWVFGSFTAGLTGVLLAPYVRLDPYGLPLLVLEVIAVAVAARMRSLPVAVGVALAIGVGQAQLTRFHPTGWAGPLVQAVGANLFVVALLVVALAAPAVRAGPRDVPAQGRDRGGAGDAGRVGGGGGAARAAAGPRGRRPADVGAGPRPGGDPAFAGRGDGAGGADLAGPGGVRGPGRALHGPAGGGPRPGRAEDAGTGGAAGGGGAGGAAGAADGLARRSAAGASRWPW